MSKERNGRYDPDSRQKGEDCLNFLVQNFGQSFASKVMTVTLANVKPEEFQEMKDNIQKVFPDAKEKNQEVFKCMDTLRQFNQTVKLLPSKSSGKTSGK